MGIFSGLLGNASNMSTADAEQKLNGMLIPGETVELAYKLIRDTVIFTNKRLIVIDVQEMTGKKKSYQTLPYKSISRFSIETAGHFDLDAELLIYISSSLQPAVTLTFSRDKHISDIQQALAVAVLNS